MKLGSVVTKKGEGKEERRSQFCYLPVQKSRQTIKGKIRCRIFVVVVVVVIFVQRRNYRRKLMIVRTTKMD